MTSSNLDNQNHNARHPESNHRWRETYTSRPYYNDLKNNLPDIDYDRDLSSAYEFGHNARFKYGENARFEDSESDMKEKWENVKLDSRLKWEHAKHAVKDAWDKI